MQNVFLVFVNPGSTRPFLTFRRRVFMNIKKSLVLAAAVAAAVAAPGAFATNGYFAHGYGTRAQGMAGAGVALPQDALAAATHPAGMVLVGNRIDVGMMLF